jgi:hypothetical protein
MIKPRKSLNKMPHMMVQQNVTDTKIAIERQIINHQTWASLLAVISSSIIISLSARASTWHSLMNEFLFCGYFPSIALCTAMSSNAGYSVALALS